MIIDILLKNLKAACACASFFILGLQELIGRAQVLTKPEHRMESMLPLSSKSSKKGIARFQKKNSRVESIPGGVGTLKS